MSWRSRPFWSLICPECNEGQFRDQKGRDLHDIWMCSYVMCKNVNVINVRQIWYVIPPCLLSPHTHMLDITSCTHACYHLISTWLISPHTQMLAITSYLYALYNLIPIPKFLSPHRYPHACHHLIPTYACYQLILTWLFSLYIHMLFIISYLHDCFHLISTCLLSPHKHMLAVAWYPHAWYPIIPTCLLSSHTHMIAILSNPHACYH